MGRRDKKRSKTLHQQVYDRLTEMQCFGESKHMEKSTGNISDKIYSFSTYKSYSRVCQSFVKYIRLEHPHITTLRAAKKYVNDYLQKRVDSGYSAWTISLDTSALCKLYQIKPDDPKRFHPPTRRRADLTRSRGHVKSDKHFSEKNHTELIDFCRGTGCRRNVLEKLTRDDLWSRERMEKFVTNINAKENATVSETKQAQTIRDALKVFPEYQYFIHHRQDKGGKYRFAPIIGTYTDRIVARMQNSPAGQRVFLHVPHRADIHSYRADYATQLYRDLLARSKSIDKLPQKERYYCRRDEKGKVLSKPVMSAVSKALGHNRISVIAASYLHDI